MIILTVDSSSLPKKSLRNTIEKIEKYNNKHQNKHYYDELTRSKEV